MHVELGPVPSEAVRAWIDYGRTVLAVVRGEPGDTPPRVVTAFADYLEQWQRAADAAPTFRWAGEIAPEKAEYLIAWLYRLGLRMEVDAERGVVPWRPPSADRFHAHLTHAVLDALEAVGPSQAQFAEQLRADWDIARRED